MKKIAFAFLFIIFTNDFFSQSLWSAFPSESQATSTIFIAFNGTTELRNKETTNYSGEKIIVKSNYIEIGYKYSVERYTFNPNDFETYRRGFSDAVFYKAKDNSGNDYKLYFDIDNQGRLFNTPPVKAIHLIYKGEYGLDSRTWLIY